VPGTERVTIGIVRFIRVQLLSIRFQLHPKSLLLKQMSAAA
jgi:hypothetical protein